MCLITRPPGFRPSSTCRGIERSRCTISTVLSSPSKTLTYPCCPSGLGSSARPPPRGRGLDVELPAGRTPLLGLSSCPSAERGDACPLPVSPPEEGGTFGSGLPAPELVPSLSFLPTSTVSSAHRPADLLHPAAGHGVRHVSGTCPFRTPGRGRLLEVRCLHRPLAACRGHPLDGDYLARSSSVARRASFVWRVSSCHHDFPLRPCRPFLPRSDRRSRRRDFPAPVNRVAAAARDALPASLPATRGSGAGSHPGAVAFLCGATPFGAFPSTGSSVASPRPWPSRRSFEMRLSGRRVAALPRIVASRVRPQGFAPPESPLRRGALPPRPARCSHGLA